MDNLIELECPSCDTSLEFTIVDPGSPPTLDGPEVCPGLVATYDPRRADPESGEPVEYEKCGYALQADQKFQGRLVAEALRRIADWVELAAEDAALRRADD